MRRNYIAAFALVAGIGCSAEMAIILFELLKTSILMMISPSFR